MMTQEDILKNDYKFMPIHDFLETYKSSFQPEAIGYHMAQGFIDWYQPARDRFVVLSEKTKNYYLKKDPMFFKEQD